MGCLLTPLLGSCLVYFLDLNYHHSSSSIYTMSNICYFGDDPVGHYDTHHMRDDMNKQFASKASTSISSFDPNFKVHQASFQAYKIRNEDRTAVLRTNYGFIVGVFDGTHNNSF